MARVQLPNGVERDALPGELPDAPAPLPVTATALSPLQWAYGLDLFALRASIETFSAALQPVALKPALQFKARAMGAKQYVFEDVLALLAAYRDTPGFPAELDLTEAQLAAMWAEVLEDLP